MRFKLLQAHVINDAYIEKGAVIEDPPPSFQPTPLMEGLDDEAREAIKRVKLSVFGRYPWPHGLYPPGSFGIPPLDDPPLDRPLDDNQPEYHFVGEPEYTK